MAEYEHPHPEVTKMVNNLDPKTKEVFIYMDNQYKIITNDGEDYRPEHDDEVANLASNKFNITAEEAGDIYVDVQMKMGEIFKP